MPSPLMPVYSPIMPVLFWGYFSVWLIAEILLLRTKRHWGLKLVGFIIISQVFYSTSSYDAVFGAYNPSPQVREALCGGKMETYYGYINRVLNWNEGLTPAEARKRMRSGKVTQISNDLIQSGCAAELQAVKESIHHEIDEREKDAYSQ